MPRHGGAADRGEHPAEGVEGEIPAGVVEAADVGVGEAESREEFEEFVAGTEAPANEHGQDRPEAWAGPAVVDDVTERLEHGDGDDGGDEGVGGLVELEHARDEPRLVENRRALLRGGQQTAGEVDGAGN